MAWSYILDFENEANPFFERRYTIDKWKHIAAIDISENDLILNKALIFNKYGLKAKDALHIACAIETLCDYFLTTDDLILKKMHNHPEINVISPIQFIQTAEIENL